MKNMKLNAVLIAGLALAWCPAARGAVPNGWFPAGSHPKDYTMNVDRDTVHGGKASATLKSVVPKTGGFGTLMQMFKADEYRSKRLRMSGYVRAQDVKDWAGLWLRVDGPGDKMLSFDNMQDRAVKGTKDWARYEIVLDVPEASQQIAFGLLLSGTGQVWMDDLKFEVVGKDVPTTGSGSGANGGQKAARNLDFEE